MSYSRICAKQCHNEKGTGTTCLSCSIGFFGFKMRFLHVLESNLCFQIGSTQGAACSLQEFYTNLHKNEMKKFSQFSAKASEGQGCCVNFIVYPFPALAACLERMGGLGDMLFSILKVKHIYMGSQCLQTFPAWIQHFMHLRFIL